MTDRSCITYNIFITLIRTLYSNGNCTNDTLEFSQLRGYVQYLNFYVLYFLPSYGWYLAGISANCII